MVSFTAHSERPTAEPVYNNTALASKSNQGRKHRGQEHRVVLPVPPHPVRFKSLTRCSLKINAPSLVSTHLFVCTNLQLESYPDVLYRCNILKLWVSHCDGLLAEVRRLGFIKWALQQGYNVGGDPKLYTESLLTEPLHYDALHPEGVYYWNLALPYPWNWNCVDMFVCFCTAVLWRNIYQVPGVNF